MDSLGNRILNLGTDANYSNSLNRKIRLTSIISIAGIIVSLTFWIYAVWSKLPLVEVSFIGLIVFLTIIPLVLNHFKKNISGRIFLVISYNFSLLGLMIILGEKLDFQYFYIPLIYTIFLLFSGKNSIKLKRFLFIGTITILMYSYWHFKAFAPLIIMDVHTTNILSFINNILAFLVCLSIYNFFVLENEFYIDKMMRRAKLLDEKNQHLEDFAYTAAHNLNKPLENVNSYIDIIKEDHFQEKDEAIETYFMYIKESMLRMQAMIDGLLSYSRIGQSSDLEDIDVKQLLADVQVDLGQVIKEKKVRIKTNNLPKLQCYTIEIRQLFQNLITNAIKFQSPGTTPILEISCIDKKTHWEFCFTDNGIGIHPKNLKNIFQVFKRLHLKTEYAGQGIGLAFCKKVVEIHYGTIWVTSTPGKGSQFYFTISKNIILNRSIKI